MSAAEGEEEGAEAKIEQLLRPKTRICSIINPPKSKTEAKESTDLVTWMNDIEKDSVYDRFPTHIQSLFPMSYFGMQMETGNFVPQYRKNLFHVVTFLDVNSPMSGAVCNALQEVWRTGEAVKLGVVAYSSDDLVLEGSEEEEESLLSVHQRLARSFHVVEEFLGAHVACQMLGDAGKKYNMLQHVATEEEAAMKDLSQLMKKYSKKLKKKFAKPLDQMIATGEIDLDNKLEVSKNFKKAVNKASRSAKFAQNVGFAGSNDTAIAVTVNGVFVGGSQALREGLEPFLNQKPLEDKQVYRELDAFFETFSKQIQAPLKEEVARARQLYHSYAIGQEDSALDKLLEWKNCVPRYSTDLMKAQMSSFSSNPSKGCSEESNYSPIDFSREETESYKALFSAEHKWLDAREEEEEEVGPSTGYIAVIGDGSAGWSALCSIAKHLDSKLKQTSAKYASTGINAVASVVTNSDSGSNLHAFIDTVVSSFSARQSINIFTKACHQLEERALLTDSLQADEELVKEGGIISSLRTSMTALDISEMREMKRKQGRENAIASGLGMGPGQSGIVTSNLVMRVKEERKQEIIVKDLMLMDVVFTHALFGDALRGSALGTPSSRMSASSFLIKTFYQKQAKSPLILDDGGQSQFVTEKVHELASTCSQSCVKLQMTAPEENMGNISGNLDIVLVVDPLSKFAQRISPLLSFLRHTFSGTITLILWPKFGFDDLPIKTYYAYAIPQWPADDTNVLWPNPLAAHFTSLPSTTTLSTQLDTPEAWLTGATVASLDLDNLKLEDLGSSASTMYAEFEIESLIVSGSCMDLTAMETWNYEEMYPTGLRLMMGSGGEEENSLSREKKKQHFVDTMVMKNLGYFQLKASPGRFSLGLVPGCSSEMFQFAGGNVHKSLLVSSFDGSLDLSLMVERVDHKNADVLMCEKEESAKGKAKANANANSAAVPEKKTSWLARVFGKKSEPNKTNNGNTLNIFSVASGHLYERFLRIMILSVIKNTQSPVKFWFIKNYMSPKLKKVLPAMAKEYNFDYELITYKWPSWVLRQTEKQRIIWAYKILFLDVIFPMSLDRVIYVDADQVVRSDLMDLQNMDIGGRPYAYTPFCDNYKEMDGFRFWKQGFWQGHLKGKPYHISALYLVDLQAFRGKGAGDDLRILYNGLAKDPNSLSNLDQDLPNYAQDLVPIFSLPQEWLYCETWCGKKSKSKAKTIDLCNNPMTKEPKLQSAKRIVSEWTSLDEEQHAFVERIEGVATSSAAASQKVVTGTATNSDKNEL
jgi:hypothetical protein